MIRIPAAAVLPLALAALAQPAFAACIVDYETMELREPTASDPASMEREQRADAADWYINGETITVRDVRYEKYGLPRVLAPFEIRFWAFIGSVPVTVDASSEEREPIVIYVLSTPADCAFQPYQRVQ